MSKTNSFFSKIVKNKLAMRVLVIVIIVAVILMVVKVFFYNGEEEVKSTYLGTQLTKIGELTTVKLHYTGLAEYKDKGIAIINKSNFLMQYEADARVGINLEKVLIDVDNIKKIVWLTIPKAEIQDVNVDESKLKYFDEKFSLFNLNEKEDGNKAIAIAEKQAKEDFGKMGVLESADEQALTLIKGLLYQTVPSEYTFKAIKKN